MNGQFKIALDLLIEGMTPDQAQDALRAINATVARDDYLSQESFARYLIVSYSGDRWDEGDKE